MFETCVCFFGICMIKYMKIIIAVRDIRKDMITMQKGPISKKQQEILDYMKNEILTRGFPPSVREICDAVHLRSTSSVHAHLEALEKHGYIRKDATKPRAIEIIDDDFRDQRFPSLGNASHKNRKAEDGFSEDMQNDSEFARVPMIGQVAAGQPLLAVEQIESYFPIPVNRLPNEQTFLLKVKGESMIDAGILDGDYVLVKEQHTAEDGEMVVALVDDSATVKTFYREKGHIRLQPQNAAMSPIIISSDQELQILGTVIGVFRFFK